MAEKTGSRFQKKPLKRNSSHERLKWETARELGLADDLAQSGKELSAEEAGKIGGHMVKKLVKAGKEALTSERNPQKS